MKIVTVCGMGIGTSILLKMNTEKALRALGMDRDWDVEAADIGTARGVARSADLVLTSADLAESLAGMQTKMVVIKNFTDIQEITDRLKEAVDED